MTAMDQEKLAGCLEVLARLGDPDLDPADRQVLERAVTSAARKIKQRAKSRRSAETRAADRALLSAATRFRTEIPSTSRAPDAVGAEPAGSAGTLRRFRRCYVCKSEYREVDADYHLLCPA
jgi:hypothetical protein